MTTVSVITICLNAAGTIEQTIRSVKDQIYSHIEYVIIDGGSTDGTLDIIERHRGRVDYYVSEPDEGLYNAMNKGIRVATGDILFFLNADDRFADNEVVADLMEVFDKHPELEIVYGDTLIDYPEGLRKKTEPSTLTRRSLCYSTVCHQGLFTRNGLFKRVGGFSELYHVVSDFDWLYRAVVIEGASSMHVGREIAVIGSAGRSYVTTWDQEKRQVLHRYYSNREILLWRELPRKVYPKIRLLLALPPLRWVRSLFGVSANSEYWTQRLARKKARRNGKSL